MLTHDYIIAIFQNFVRDQLDSGDFPLGVALPYESQGHIGENGSQNKLSWPAYRLQCCQQRTVGRESMKSVSFIFERPSHFSLSQR
jgi:hypothetical protein